MIEEDSLGAADDKEFVEVISEDGQPFRVSRKAFSSIGIFRSAAQDLDMSYFPIHAVTSNILSRVIEYLEAHKDDDDDATSDEGTPRYTPYTDLIIPKDRTFLNTLDLPTLIEVTKAANYLHIPDLLELCCKAVAGHMRGLSTEQLRAKFNIVNDFTPEEEERLRQDTSWCFE